MRIRLALKTFVAFLLTSFMVVALMVGIMRFYVARNLANYVTKVRLEKLDDLVNALIKEYQKKQGWDSLRSNPSRWGEISRAGRSTQDLDRSILPPGAHKASISSPPPKAPHLETGPFENPGRNRPPPPPSVRPWRIEPRVTLFDEQKHQIAGGPPGTFPDRQALREIAVDGKTIGWIGLPIKGYKSNPLAIGFLKQQYQACYLTGGSILLLAAIVAFLLSKHLLAPIRQLTAGMQALTAFKFGTRIAVHTGDELGQLAADFNVMARTLEKYEQMRKQWISDISHELRTPLSILRGEIEALQDGVRESNRQALDLLHLEAMHISKIVDDLHELSVADTGILRLNKKPVKPIRILKESVNLFRTQLTQAQITIEEDLETGQNITLMGDADRLAQMFTNLLENTLRYTDAPGTLRLRQKSDKTHLTFILEDTGPGVPEASLEHLFDRLYRVDSSRTRTKGGSGLGLSICKAIVESHDGKITAVNAPSGGLRIQIELPLTTNTEAYRGRA